jgi:uncharacterized membrane protein YvbJ
MADEMLCISDTLLERLKFFIEDNDAQRVSRNLRKVFIDYLKFQDGVSDNDFDKILTDVEAVFELLDALAVEKNGRDKPA